jgi:hypothetical protein
MYILLLSNTSYITLDFSSSVGRPVNLNVISERVCQQIVGINCINIYAYMRAGITHWYSDLLWASRSGNLIPVGARISAPVLTDSGAHSASCTMRTVCLFRR